MYQRRSRHHLGTPRQGGLIQDDGGIVYQTELFKNIHSPQDGVRLRLCKGGVAPAMRSGRDPSSNGRRAAAVD